jgi:succinylarginine dihydrolase
MFVYLIRVQMVLMANKRVFAALEKRVRGLLVMVDNPLATGDAEATSLRVPDHNEAHLFLSQLVSYGQGLLQEVLSIDLKSLKV